MSFWKCRSGLPTLRRVTRAALLLAVVIAVLSAPERAAAQAALHASEEQLVNFAYATQLGSGIYGISGRTLQIYRLPFGYTFTQPSGKRPGVRLTLPLTVGFVVSPPPVPCVTHTGADQRILPSSCVIFA